mmetsp:Transcript_48206/g.145635  ORF Transcript_48206/g.145635 Transcript_48206/m.145635 type:complete len:1386 (-) Transcript_48206:1873-6030(-)
MLSDGDSEEQRDVGSPSSRNEFLSQHMTPAMEYNAPVCAAGGGGAVVQQMRFDSGRESVQPDGAGYRRRPSPEGVGRMKRRGSAGRGGLGMQRRPSLSNLATGDRMQRRPSLGSLATGERMQRRPSCGALETGETRARRPSLGSLATGERTARQVSSRDLGGAERDSRRRSRSRGAIGRSAQRRPSLGNLVDVDSTDRRRSRSRDPIGRNAFNMVRQPSAGSIDADGNADRIETNRRDGFQRHNSLSMKQQTAKELLPLVGWDASDAASSIAERDQHLHEDRQPQHRTNTSIRNVMEQEESTSLDGQRNSSDIGAKEQTGNSQDKNATVDSRKPGEEASPVMGWGTSDAASSIFEEEQVEDEGSNGSGDDGTEIYEDFRPRGDFRENTNTIPEPKVEEEFDSRRPWRKAPVDKRPQLNKGTSETGSVMSFSMDANAAIPKECSASKIDTGSIDEATGGDQIGTRQAGLENFVRKGGPGSSIYEGSELDELEMAHAALNRTEFTFSDDRRTLRSELVRRANEAIRSDIYTNPYETCADADYDDLEVAKKGKRLSAGNFGNGHEHTAGDTIRLEPTHEQSLVGQYQDHPGPYIGPIESESADQPRNQEVRRSSFTSSSEEEEDEEEIGNPENLISSRNNNDAGTSKVEVDTSLFENVAHPKKDAAGSQTSATAQVHSESTESGQRQCLDADDASREHLQYPDEEGMEANLSDRSHGEMPSGQDTIMCSAMQHQSNDEMMPLNNDPNHDKGKNNLRVSFESKDTKRTSGQVDGALTHGEDVDDSEYDEEEAKDTFDAEGGLQQSGFDQRHKMLEIAQFGSSFAYHHKPPDEAAPPDRQDSSNHDWPAFAEQEMSDPTLGEKDELKRRGSAPRRFPSMFMSFLSRKFSSREGKIQRCVGPYVWERRKLFLIGFLVSLVLIAGLAAAFAVVKNGNTPRNSVSSAPSSMRDGAPVPSLAPTISPSPTISASPTKLRAPNSSSTPSPALHLPPPTSASYSVLQTIEGYNDSFAGFSTSFSSDGTFVAIGFKGTNGVDEGKAKVYRLNNGTWSLLGSGISSSASGYEFGSSLSISDDGQRLAVGARNNGDESSGNVQVFQYSEDLNDWEQIGRTIVGEYKDRAGYSVAISGNGNRIAVGAPRGGIDTGSVRIFEYIGVDWDLVGQELLAEGHQVLGGYSCSLSRDGNIVAMSVPRSNREGLQKNGHVSIYRLEESTPSWQKIGDDIIGENSLDQNGISVSLSADGTRVAIGANGFDHDGVKNVGYCRVFRNEGSSWAQLGSPVRGNLHGEQSGFSISLSGDGNRVACGGANSPLNGTRSGVVRVYEYIEKKNDWVQIGDELILEDKGARREGAAFGHSVSLTETGDYLAVGAPERMIDDLPNVGSLSVYMLVE